MIEPSIRSVSRPRLPGLCARGRLAARDYVVAADEAVEWEAAGGKFGKNGRVIRQTSI